jgi:ABC-type multidrug transport system fused ATPase/permease subunit
MLYLFKNLPQRYYAFWLWLANLKSKVRIIPIDFSKAWTAVIRKQKKYLFIALAGNAFTHVFYTLVPLFLGWVIEAQSFTYFYLLIAGWLCALLVEYFILYNTSLLEVQCMGSIQYNAFKFFLTVDPIYHATKSTGKLFAKIERGARAYEDFLDLLLLDLSPTFISVTTVVISFLWAQVSLGVSALILLALVAFLNVTLNLFTSLAFEKNLIEADDAIKSISVESLTQVQLIRASFATNEIAHTVKRKNFDMMVREGSAWLAFSATNFITRFSYVLTILILGTLILRSVLDGTLTIISATALILTYIRGTSEIIQVGRRLRKLLKSIIRIRDLFSFIRSFGKQTFSVLATPSPYKDILEEKIQQPTIVLEAQDLHFDYNPKAKIFENHNLFLEVQKKEKNKLYGIIGPSGMGKTTLLSILGGQLKPDRGSVTLNEIPIYEVDDIVRRRLIAVQGQIATSMSGTVKQNLLLGLPQEEVLYSDKDIITVLQEVGLWHIFEEKEGLATPIGEGGFTLSGGQRQRLNFAGLYLRARYYDPLLILIDEPTSSLDEVSERAITTMISYLAEHALTLVIAHRLKTLETAQGILDFSLLEEEKDFTFYTREELAQKSVYYRKLIQGDITIET